VAETTQASGARHRAACGKQIRERMLGQSGSPEPVPGTLVEQITAAIAGHCRHPLLKCRRIAMGWTVEQAVAAVHAFRAGNDLPAAGLTQRSWKDWEAGHPPGAYYQDLICQVLATGPVQLGFATDYTSSTAATPARPLASADARLTPGTTIRRSGQGEAEGEETDRRGAVKLTGLAALAPGVLADVLGQAAGEAMEFTRQAEASALGAGTLQHLQAAVAEFNAGYSAKPPRAMFDAVMDYRRKIGHLLAGPHTLRQRRELYTCAGWLSELLAWLAHDLGHGRAGAAFATDAYRHAVEAGHGELAAWAMDAAASIALYQHRPDRALRAARHGIGHAPSRHPLTVRLHAQAARAQAAAGNADGFASSFRAAQTASGRLRSRSPDRFGRDTGPLAEFALTAYPASSCIWLGQAQAARGHAEKAIAIYESVPAANRSPSREAIARLDLALALAHLGSAGDACTVGSQALGSPRFVDSVRSRAEDLAAHLARSHPRLPQAQEFRERLRALTATGSPQ